MDSWLIAIWIYAGIAVLTFIPVILALFKRVKLHPGGDSFGESQLFSEESKKRLAQHFSRIKGTLVFWKNEAEKYKRLHFYVVFWTIPSLVLIPILVQFISDNQYSKLFLTLISAHTTILLSFHRGLKVEKNYRAFREGESEFYDLYRRLLDRPQTFGLTEEEQLNKYFDDVENVRKFVRNAEVDNFPTVEQVKVQMSDEKNGSSPSSLKP